MRRGFVEVPKIDVPWTEELQALEEAHLQEKKKADALEKLIKLTSKVKEAVEKGEDVEVLKKQLGEARRIAATYGFKC